MDETENERRLQQREMIGKIVHFYPYGTKTKVRPFPFVAAMITDVALDGTVTLMTFPPGSGPVSPGHGPVPISYSGVPERGVKVDDVTKDSFWVWPSNV